MMGSRLSHLLYTTTEVERSLHENPIWENIHNRIHKIPNKITIFSEASYLTCAWLAGIYKRIKNKNNNLLLEWKVVYTRKQGEKMRGRVERLRSFFQSNTEGWGVARAAISCIRLPLMFYKYFHPITGFITLSLASCMVWEQLLPLA